MAVTSWGGLCSGSTRRGTAVYNWSEEDNLIAYQLSGGRLTGPYAQGQVISPGHPGGSLTVSANGSTAGTGIVWASMPTNHDAKHILTGGILRAYHAETLAQLWTSEQNATRDRAGTLIKFVPPVVAKGKVYMANHDNGVGVYGLLPGGFSVSASPTSKTIPPGTSATFSVSVGAQGGFARSVALSASGAPAGTTVTFNPRSVTGSGTATMTVAVPSGVTVNSFTLTVRGTNASQTQSTAVVVNVKSGTGNNAAALNNKSKSRFRRRRQNRPRRVPPVERDLVCPLFLGELQLCHGEDVPVGAAEQTSRSSATSTETGRPLAVYRPHDGGWYVRHSSSNYSQATWAWDQWGVPTTSRSSAISTETGRRIWSSIGPERRRYVRFSSSNYSFATWTSYQWGLPTTSDRHRF